MCVNGLFYTKYKHCNATGLVFRASSLNVTRTRGTDKDFEKVTLKWDYLPNTLR